MTKEQVGGIIRALISAVGGYFVGQGLVDANTVATVAGALSTIIVAVWSFKTKQIKV